jgi:hypothetical protein
MRVLRHASVAEGLKKAQQAPQNISGLTTSEAIDDGRERQTKSEACAESTKMVCLVRRNPAKANESALPVALGYVQKPSGC